MEDTLRHKDHKSPHSNREEDSRRDEERKKKKHHRHTKSSPDRDADESCTKKHKKHSKHKHRRKNSSSSESEHESDVSNDQQSDFRKKAKKDIKRKHHEIDFDNDKTPSDDKSRKYHDDDTANTKKNKEGKEKESTLTNRDRPNPVNMGQWGSASFDDAARQDKFFRLMGGFKKSTGAKSSQDTKSKFANAAMGQNDAETMEKKLATQYDHAWDTTRNKRGLGLGYDPTADEKNKTFHIDKDQCNSTKFV